MADNIALSLKVDDGKIIGNYGSYSNTVKQYTIDASSISSYKYFRIGDGLVLTTGMNPSGYSSTFACRGIGNSETETGFCKVQVYSTSLISNTAATIPSYGISVKTNLANSPTPRYVELCTGYFLTQDPYNSNKYRECGYFEITTKRTDLTLKSVVFTPTAYGSYLGTSYTTDAMPNYVVTYTTSANGSHVVHWHHAKSQRDYSDADNGDGKGNGYSNYATNPPTNYAHSPKVYYMAILSNY